ncbi:PQQ-binding-like beta-propeller repeat protein [Mangrovibacterium sp.]|uniref:outer membrane protein assembly factor BamB family protein n=1 Tax=Mangrovibacterium sp. TaxID=1961364 RepID=UPI003569A5E7
MKQIISLLFICVVALQLSAQESSPWRGVNSDAKYPAPQILPAWAETGPEIIWHFDGLGDGFSSPVFTNGKIYCSAMEDSIGYIYIISENGELLKKVAYGNEFNESFPGSRSTPAIIGNTAYMVSGFGVLYCLDLETGKQVWNRRMKEDYKSENTRWGYTQSIFIDGDHLYFTPGGEEFNFVALNRLNGDLIWKSAGNQNLSAYCTPKLVEKGGRKLLVSHMANDIVAVDAANGKVLWTYPHPNQYNIHPNTPIFQDGDLYCFSGYGQGGVRLHLNEDGSAVTKVWSTNQMDNQMGGAIFDDGMIYGSGHRNRGWFCLDWKNGDVKWQSTEIGNGVIIMAGDKFILYSDRGELALAQMNSEKMEVLSKTKIELGTAQHWAHPVVHNGVLYVRHGKSLIAYKISA